MLHRLARDGTPVIALGSAVAGMAAYAFQVIGGRSLGDEGFAPVAALLSIHSLILAVLLSPVELLTVRRLALVRGGAPDRTDQRSIVVTSAAALLIMMGFVGLTLDRFFEEKVEFLAIAAAVLVTHVIFSLGRGALAGRGRYLSYGSVSAVAALARIPLALAFLAWIPSATTLSLAIALPPLLILIWAPFGKPLRRVPRREGSGSLMAGFVLAGAISHALIIAGPLVAGQLVSDPARVAGVVSVVFVTFSLARAPVLIAQNLSARLLAGLTALVATNSLSDLRLWSRRLTVTGIAAAPLAYAAGAGIGPPLIARLFGESFRPSATLAGLAGAACVLAASSALLDQVLVAMGLSGRLAGAWLAALAATGVTIAAAGGPAGDRVAMAVFVGEAVALLAVAITAELSTDNIDDLRQAIKRIFDVTVATVLAVLTLPLQLGLAAAIRLDSPGPAIFRQPRVGKGGRHFDMLKFRTMAGTDPEPLDRHLKTITGPIEPSLEGTGPRLLIEDDPRVTRVGRALRRTSFDELPNLWNVINGDMSLVGPRPLVPAEAALLSAESLRRHDVRPGITGLAQVRGASEMTFSERAWWDLEYVQGWSLGLDLRIMLETPASAFRRGRPVAAQPGNID